VRHPCRIDNGGFLRRGKPRECFSREERARLLPIVAPAIIDNRASLSSGKIAGGDRDLCALDATNDAGAGEPGRKNRLERQRDDYLPGSGSKEIRREGGPARPRPGSRKDPILLGGVLRRDCRGLPKSMRPTSG